MYLFINRNRVYNELKVYFHDANIDRLYCQTTKINIMQVVEKTPWLDISISYHKILTTILLPMNAENGMI